MQKRTPKQRFVPPTRAQYEQHRGGRTDFVSYEAYVANTRAAHERVLQTEDEIEQTIDSMRELIRTEPQTHGQLLWNLRPNKHISEALRRMVGEREGAKTQGELVIAGYRSGSEVYALRGTPKSRAKQDYNMSRKSPCEKAGSALGTCSAKKKKAKKKAAKKKVAKKKKAAKKPARKRATAATSSTTTRKPAKKRGGKPAKKAPQKVAKRKTGKKAGSAWRFIQGDKIQPAGTKGRRYRYRLIKVGNDTRLDAVEFKSDARGWQDVPNANVRAAILQAALKPRKKSSRKKTKIVEKTTIIPHPRSGTIEEKTSVTRPMGQHEFDYYLKKLTGA